MEILNEILDKHNIKETFDNAKKMDKENRIFISDNFVVKLYFPRKYNYYYNELKVYQSLCEKDYLPKLYFHGEHPLYKYIVISKLEGKSLFDSWDSYSLAQRNDFIEQIAVIMKDINHIEQKQVKFKSEFENKFNDVFSSLNLSPKTKSEINELYENRINFLQENEMGNLIHTDVHFYNFFVNEKKLYAYDFENMTLAPLDYQLLRWYRMWRYPQTFYHPKNSLTEKQIDSYKILMPSLIVNYPDLMINNNSEERIKLYSLLYLLQETKRCNLNEEKVKYYIKDNISVRL